VTALSTMDRGQADDQLTPANRIPVAVSPRLIHTITQLGSPGAAGKRATCPIPDIGLGLRCHPPSDVADQGAPMREHPEASVGGILRAERVAGRRGGSHREVRSGL